MAAFTVDFQLCFIAILLWLFSCFCLSAFFFKKRKEPELQDCNLPPSPPSVPVIAHLHLLLSVPIHKSFQKLSSKYGPLLYLRAFTSPIVLVSSGSMAYEKLLVTNLLGSHSLERTRLIRGEELRTFRAMLFDKATKNEAVDVGKEMINLTNNTICRMIMGRKCSEETRRLFLIASTVGRLLKKLGISLFEKEIMEVSQKYDELLEKIIKEREDNPNKKEDSYLIDVLLEVCADDNAESKVSRNQIKALFCGNELFLGGTETSGQTTSWIMAELINHPEMLKRLREEIESVVGKMKLIQETDLSNLLYLQAVVKEGLRLHPHSPIVGFTSMIINTYAVMRDPDSWEEPDEFQPERFMVPPSKGNKEMREQLDLNYIPFGSGRRGCPGSNLGSIFVGLAIGTMIQCFDWSIDGEKVNMEEAGDVNLSMAHPLKCTLVARDPLASFMSADP
ncbi:hypothetical protein Bca52824_064878 [Brassica carinata]|uniref:Cytochrome P450 n=1 Tax=Brassica carinata TaxID=52824 RepID=A0A8X7QID9_BRACI|nr:hypothetical protein Bca52824_064878 [Brassica carinata]